MTKHSRRSFIATTAAAALAAGCDSSAPPEESTSAQQIRNHPLDGIVKPNIKIADIKVTPISWVDPNRNIWRSGNNIVWKTDGCITQVYTDQGIVGIGEGTPYEGPINIKKDTEEIIKPLMIGKNPFDVEYLTNRGNDNRRNRAPWAGFVNACWDIIGKALGKPVYELLAVDHEPRREITMYASGGDYHEWYNNGEQTLIEEALQYKEEGYDCFKFRTGTSWSYSNMTLEKYIPILERLRNAVGPDFKLCHESMGGTRTSHEDILKIFCPALEDLGFYWFEEAPGGTTMKDFDFFLQLQEALPTVMVSGGERFRERFETQVWLDRGALDLVQVDCNIAGLIENWYISRMAHIRGIISSPHNWHGGGTIMTNVHLAAGIPNNQYCELNQTHNPLKEEIFKEPFIVAKGKLKLPDKPGYGVEIIDDLEKRFPYEPGSYNRPNPILQKS